MREFGTRAVPATDAARTKQRIGGALLFVGISINLVATLLPLTPGYRPLATVLFCIGGACLLGAIFYMIKNRKAS
jgi:hypothetical protein